MKTNTHVLKSETYKITVRTLGGHILTFTVDNYNIIDGDFVSFVDKKTNIILKFHSSNCEIRNVEVRE